MRLSETVRLAKGLDSDPAPQVATEERAQWRRHHVPTRLRREHFRSVFTATQHLVTDTPSYPQPRCTQEVVYPYFKDGKRESELQ